MKDVVRVKMEGDEKERMMFEFSRLGVIYRTNLGGYEAYRYRKGGKTLDIFIKFEDENGVMVLGFEGDSALRDEILSEIGYGGETKAEKKSGHSSEISLNETGMGKIREIRRPTLETHDEHIPYILPGFYRFYGSFLPPLLSLNIKNTSNKEKIIKVEAEVPSYSERYVKTFNLDGGNEIDLSITPPLKKVDVKEVVESSLRYVVFKDDVPAEEQTYGIKIYSPLDFMLGIEAEGRLIDFYPLLAAWVTPHAPEVEDIIKSASSIKKELSGDGSMGVNADDEEVMLQLKAIYSAIQNLGIEYINTPVSFGPGAAQRIRYLGDVLRSGGGNCIELTIMFASIMEAIELSPLIVLVPGHAFLGVRMPSGNSVFIESTVVSGHDFEYAVNTGNEEFQRHQSKDEIIGIIDVEEMRAQGVIPNEIPGD